MLKQFFTLGLMITSSYSKKAYYSKNLHNELFENSEEISPEYEFNQVNDFKINYDHGFTKVIFNEELELHTKKFKENHYLSEEEIVYDEIEIPLVFHIIYNDETQYKIDGYSPFALSEQILENRIVKQLNEDYNMENEDLHNNIPEEWKSLLGNFKVRFHTKMIKYIPSNKEYWDVDNGEQETMKYDKYGGSDVIDSELNLNIWIVNIRPNDEGLVTMGYVSELPGDSLNHEIDGYVLNAYSFLGPIDRTSTHEIGHWMNLHHIWGDGAGDSSKSECNNNDFNDFVDDTPLSSDWHIGCGSSVICSYPATSSCGTPDMFMNYMSYGEQTNMFTYDQMLRSRALFVEGGARYSMVTQEKPPVDDELTTLVIVFLIVGTFIILFLICIFVKWLYNLILKCKVSKENVQQLEVDLEAQEIDLPIPQAENKLETQEEQIVIIY